MLIQFSLQNYKSINGELTLSTLAESLRQKASTNVFHSDAHGLKLLKAIVMYGANASGKTNILNGLTFMRDFVLNSSRYHSIQQEIQLEPYRLIYSNLSKPSRFEVEIIIDENRYIYGFESSKSRIHSEWLHRILKTTKKICFERENDEIEVDQSFREGFHKTEFVRPNSLFLSTVGQFNGRISMEVIRWFENTAILTEYNTYSNTAFTASLIQDPQLKSLLLQLFKDAKLEFDDIEVQEIDLRDNLIELLGHELQELIQRQSRKQVKIWTKHKIFNKHGESNETVNFDLKEESAGTQKFFAIVGPIVNSLLNGYPILIDELDSKLHVKLVEYVLNLFCGENNVRGGQLICINHTTAPLSSGILRRDQVMLISKDLKGTRIKSIHDMNVRNDASFEKDYLKGEYGAVPNTEMNQLRLFDLISKEK